MDNTIAISVQQVSKSFKDEVILKSITHDFKAGQVHGIVGNNGSGKTVLFKCICGFIRPTSGKIFVDGLEIGKTLDFPENMGIIIETPGFLMNLSGYKNLELLASLRKKITRAEILDTLERVGLSSASRKPVGKYSLGMRQRLGIAQAIMEDPMHLILDEPFNGLDKRGVSDMRNLLKEFSARGKTILLASHNANDIEELCDTVCEMDAGALEVIR